MKKALTNFSKYSDAALDVKAQVIHSSLTGNAYFANPVPSLADLLAAQTAYSTALNAANSGNRSDIAIKNEKREELEDLLSKLAICITFLAEGNEAAILSSGFEMSKTPASITITKPENLQVLNGINAGELIISINAVKGAKSYLFEYTTDATLAPHNWQSIPSTKVKFTLDSLQAGTTYFCRVGAIGGNDQLLYSDTVSRMVV